MPGQISIHALLAESDARRESRQQPAGISIHALLAESDCITTITTCIVWRFLSTLSLRRATALGLPGWLRVLISIHALLAESDSGNGQNINRRHNFYPRSPCGERPLKLAQTSLTEYISIHALLAESDRQVVQTCQVGISISIHALLAESDARRESRQQPAGISIHALLAESDCPFPLVCS